METLSMIIGIPIILIGIAIFKGWLEEDGDGVQILYLIYGIGMAIGWIYIIFFR